MLQLAHEIGLLAALIRDNPDLPDARRHWAARIRDLADRAAAPPADDEDSGGAVLAWPRQARGETGREDPAA